MNLTSSAHKIHAQISAGGAKLGDLRKMAKEIKKDHELAMELWSTGEYMSRQLAILIMDKKLITPDLIGQLFRDMQKHTFKDRNQLADWLMANQLTRDKKWVSLMATWEHSPLALQRRIYWYYQARLRWTGRTPPDNTEHLLSSIEERMAKEEPEVQWAMNFTAAWIGIHESQHRSRCIALGEALGLYKEEKASKGCTPNYLPEFIRIESEKLNK